MYRGTILWTAAAASALALAGCAGTVAPQEEQTGTTASADTKCAAGGVCTTTYTGVLRSVDLRNGNVTFTVNGGAPITLQHTNATVHAGVVPGPMRGVVPGPMHWLEREWNDAIEDSAPSWIFLFLLDDLSFYSGSATITTTDNATIASVQPLK